MSDSIVIVVHQDVSTPGRVGERLRKLGFHLDIRRPACGDDLPETMDHHAGAVVFGGPMSANDDHLPFIPQERRWIDMAVESGKPFFGICLGAQMLARNLGARVEPNPAGFHEVGYYPVFGTPAGRHLFDPNFQAYQWHGEGFDHPPGATTLATGTHFPCQAFRVGDNAYGVQFHPDVTPEMQARWCARAAHRLVLPGAQSRQEQRAKARLHDPAMSAWLDRFLVEWLKLNR